MCVGVLLQNVIDLRQGYLFYLKKTLLKQIVCTKLYTTFIQDKYA